MLSPLLAADVLTGWQIFIQQCLNGLTYGALIALIALGYTMVYGIIGLINFAHGDLFMLGTFLTLTLIETLGLDAEGASAVKLVVGLLAVLPIVAVFCATLNLAVDRIVYKPLRRAPKLAPLVSAIGVSFIFQNVGLLWKGPADVSVPNLVSQRNLLGDQPITFTISDLMLIALVAAIMVALTLSDFMTRSWLTIAQ
jgi:branched-chain amino acid transport system permease protein